MGVQNPEDIAQLINQLKHLCGKNQVKLGPEPAIMFVAHHDSPYLNGVADEVKMAPTWTEGQQIVRL